MLPAGGEPGSCKPLSILWHRIWTGHDIEEMIGVHGIAGFALAAISNCAHPARVPDTLIQRLKEHSLNNAFKNLLYVREFNSLVKACNREQIRLLPLKGIAFLTTLYAHNTALRSLSDMDILFEKKDLGQVDHILRSMGYQRKQEDDEPEKPGVSFHIPTASFRYNHINRGALGF